MTVAQKWIVCTVIILSYISCEMKESMLEKPFSEVWPATIHLYQDELNLAQDEFLDFQEFINHNIKKIKPKQSIGEVYRWYQTQNDLFSKLNFELEELTYKETTGHFSNQGQDYYVLNFKLKIINHTDKTLQRALTTLSIDNSKENLYLTYDLPIDTDALEAGFVVISTIYSTSMDKAVLTKQLSNFNEYLTLKNTVYHLKLANGEEYSSPSPQ